jgi:DNA-binding response OmpR family regulator
MSLNEIPPGATGPRLAIVDDDPAQIAHLAAILRSPLSPGAPALRCRNFASGRAFRRALQRERFDLIILEWQLPDIDGIELMRWLRMERRDDIPVVMLSARCRDSEIAIARAAGASAYMIKPFRPLELRARLAQLLTSTAATVGARESHPDSGIGYRREI